MPNTAQTRSSAPRQPLRAAHAVPPELLGELRLDKGPKHIGFDNFVPMDGRRSLERALRQDRKR